jgi:hypothetical protein
LQLVWLHMQTLSRNTPYRCLRNSEFNAWPWCRFHRAPNTPWIRSTFSSDVHGRPVLLRLYMQPPSTSFFMLRVNLLMARWLFVEPSAEFTLHLNNAFALLKLLHQKISVLQSRHFTINEKQLRCVALTSSFRRASKIWTFLYPGMCGMCFCLLRFIWNTFLKCKTVYMKYIFEICCIILKCPAVLKSCLNFHKR